MKGSNKNTIVKSKGDVEKIERAAEVEEGEESNEIVEGENSNSDEEEEEEGDDDDDDDEEEEEGDDDREEENYLEMDKVFEEKDVNEYNLKQKNRGVVYISRVPPFMKVAKLRHLLSLHGEIGRIYLVEEDKAISRRRKKAGGNKKKKYVEGWIEFMDKKIARKVAECLNNKSIGGNKLSFFHDDVWNLKYLPKFKWHHLTEKIAYENRVRDQKLKAEVNQAKRENSFYIDQVEKSRKINKMKERKAAKDDAIIIENRESKEVEFKQRISNNKKRESSQIKEDVLSKILQPQQKKKKIK